VTGAQSRSGRLGVGIVGAGRVGPVLGAALGAAGHSLVGIATISDRGRDRADAMLPGVPVLDVPHLVERSELVILAIPAPELPGFVCGLAATGTWQMGQIVVHTAAEYGVDVLAPAVACGAIPLAIHPAMDFTGTSIDVSRLDECSFAVTAPATVAPIGQALVVEMGGEPVTVAEHHRAAYAEAITTATSFSAAIVEQATAILDDIGLESPGRILGSLVRSSVENALARSVPTAIHLASIDLEDT
jgi:predicted short-subunit dehydrogenase-like oxidoreductase (DUF2520 family)